MLGSAHLCGGPLPLMEILETCSPGELPWAPQVSLSSLLYQAWCLGQMMDLRGESMGLMILLSPGGILGGGKGVLPSVQVC